MALIVNDGGDAIYGYEQQHAIPSSFISHQVVELKVKKDSNRDGVKIGKFSDYAEIADVNNIRQHAEHIPGFYEANNFTANQMARNVEESNQNRPTNLHAKDEQAEKYYLEGHLAAFIEKLAAVNLSSTDTTVESDWDTHSSSGSVDSPHGMPARPISDSILDLRQYNKRKSILRKGLRRTKSTNSIRFDVNAKVHVYEQEEADYDFRPLKPTMVNINGQVIMLEPGQQVVCNEYGQQFIVQGAVPAAHPNAMVPPTYSVQQHAAPPTVVATPDGQYVYAQQHQGPVPPPEHPQQARRQNLHFQQQQYQQPQYQQPQYQQPQYQQPQFQQQEFQQQQYQQQQNQQPQYQQQQYQQQQNQQQQYQQQQYQQQQSQQQQYKQQQNQQPQGQHAHQDHYSAPHPPSPLPAQAPHRHPGAAPQGLQYPPSQPQQQGSPSQPPHQQGRYATQGPAHSQFQVAGQQQQVAYAQSGMAAQQQYLQQRGVASPPHMAMAGGGYQPPQQGEAYF